MDYGQQLGPFTKLGLVPGFSNGGIIGCRCCEGLARGGTNSTLDNALTRV